MRAMPRSSRQAASGSGSGPVSTSATTPALRTSTASPCPMSQAAICQSAGRVSTCIERMPAVALTRPTSVSSATLPATARECRDTGAMAATRAPTVTTRSSTIPGGPVGQGSAAPGSAAKKCATAAIQAAGSQATAATAPPSHGATGSSRQASSPSTVARGAAGSARALATTP